MRSDETLEPIDETVAALRTALLEWEHIATRLIEQLHADVASNRPANWRPHFAQMVKALLHYRQTCRKELGQIGLWREDGLETEELHESLWEQGAGLATWLERMVAP
ncbi:MAG: hypothetical protein ACR2ID_01180 [Chthoniobacterales bacterium]